MKKILLVTIITFSLASCAQVQQTLNQLPQLASQLPTGSVDIASGLKEALNKGITQQVSKLTAVDGFYKNEAVKILMPAELQKVDATLRKIGLSSLADEGIKVLNRAAEDAVKEATPIFVTAVKNMSFTDAKNILLGNDSAATSYLQSSTTTALYAKFNPVIKSSFEKVGADVVWTNIINKYNTIPLVKKVNPDLTDYTTNQALAGVFKMISVEEKDIRNNISARTTPLLQKVFAMQDGK
jgi:ribosomal protein S17E